jgi:hypothetical protein
MALLNIFDDQIREIARGLRRKSTDFEIVAHQELGAMASARNWNSRPSSEGDCRQTACFVERAIMSASLPIATEICAMRRKSLCANFGLVHSS